MACFLMGCPAFLHKYLEKVPTQSLCIWQQPLFVPMHSSYNIKLRNHNLCTLACFPAQKAMEYMAIQLMDNTDFFFFK